MKIFSSDLKTVICKTFRYLKYAITIKEQCDQYAIFKNVYVEGGKYPFLLNYIQYIHLINRLHYTEYNYKLEFFATIKSCALNSVAFRNRIFLFNICKCYFQFTFCTKSFLNVYCFANTWYLEFLTGIGHRMIFSTPGRV